MKGSYWAKVIEIDQQREKHLKELYSKKSFKKRYCDNCLNRKTDLCNITFNICGKPVCVEFKKEIKNDT